MSNWMLGVWIPFLGTTLGSACVFLLKDKINPLIEKMLAGFAGGVMIAASVWSLLIPSIDYCSSLGKFSFVPAFIGFWIGVLFLWTLDQMIPHLHPDSSIPEGPKTNLKKTTMLILAVTIHNIPEGIAVGVVYAGMIQNGLGVTASMAIALSVGIAIQNFPEGAIISMPLHANGLSKGKAFLYGTLSGIVEPIASIITIYALKLVLPGFPFFLAFAAGAMIYVVIEELMPEATSGKHTNWTTAAFCVGFSLMMILDVALG